MASAANRIPAEEWGRHRDRIESLSRQHKLKAVMEIMSQEGFHATRNQYEAKLRKWRSRKNLGQHEWRVVLDKIKDIRAERRQFRLRISGREISEDSIQRAERHCETRYQSRKDIPPGKSLSGLGQVVIDVLDDARAWRRTSLTDTPSESEPNQYGGDDEIRASIIAEPVPRQALEADFANVYMIEGSATESGWSTAQRSTPVMEMNVVSVAPSSPFCFHRSFKRHAGRSPSPSMLSETDYGSPGWLLQHDPAPFTTSSSSFARHLIGREFPDSNLTSGFVPSLTFGSSAVANFVTEVGAALQNKQGIGLGAVSFEPEMVLASLQQLLSHRPAHDTAVESLLAAPYALFGSALNRALMISIANGFSGLESVPVHALINYLNRQESSTPILQTLLMQPMLPFPQAIVENLFRAAIEAENTDLVAHLIDKTTLDLAGTAYQTTGLRIITPVERATELGCLPLLEVLLNSAPWSQNSHYFEETLAANLIVKCSRDNASATLGIVGTFLKRGARMEADQLAVLIDRGCPGDLIARVIKQFCKSQHADFLGSNRVVHKAYEHLEVDMMHDIVRHMLSICDSSHNGHCRIDESKGIKNLIDKGAGHGDVCSVYTLLRWSRSDGCRNLACPDISLRTLYSAGALDSGVDSRSSGLLRKAYLEKLSSEIRVCSDILHPKSSADEVEERDIQLRSIIADSELLELSDPGCARHITLEAQVILGDLGAVQSLLQFAFPDQNLPKCLAMECAFAHNHREIFWELLHHGILDKDKDTRAIMALALRQKDYEVIRALLDYGFFHASYTQEAMKLNDIDAVNIFRAIIPSISVDAKTMEHLLQTGMKEMTRFVIEAEMCDGITLSLCLEAAVREQNRELVVFLLDSGAEVILRDDPLIRGRRDALPDSLGIAFEVFPECANLLVSSLPRSGRRRRYLLAKSLHKLIRREETQGLLSFLAGGIPDLAAILNFSVDSRTALGVAIHSTAVCGGRADRVRMLVESGSRCDATVQHTEYPDGTLYTERALLAAIGARDKEVVEFLIHNGADVDEAAIRGRSRTPLQKAAEVGDLDLVQLLLNKGADPNAEAAYTAGATALQSAAISGNCTIAALLMEKGALLGAPPSRVDGRWPIEGAAEHGRFTMINYLWNLPDRGTSDGFGGVQLLRAAELAEENGHMGCKSLLDELLVSQDLFSLDS